MLPALPSLLAPPADVPVRPSPPLLEKVRYHGMPAQELESDARPGSCVGNLKTLFPAALSPMSLHHLRVARPVFVRFR